MQAHDPRGPLGTHGAALLAALLLVCPTPSLMAMPGVDLSQDEQDVLVAGEARGDQLSTGSFLSRSTAGDGVIAGDVDGDGISDLVVAAPGADGPEDDRTDAGAVLVWRGPLASGTFQDLAAGAVPDLILHGPTPGLRMGADLAFGDISGDGRPDLLMAGSGGDGPMGDRVRTGQVLVLMGPLPSAGVLDLALEPADLVIHAPGSQDAQAGIFLSLGELLRPGKLDLVVGLPAGDGPTDASPEAGEVHVLFGPLRRGVRDLAERPGEVRVYGGSPRAAGDDPDRLGHRPAVGDLDHDGSPDLVLVAPGGDGPGGSRPDIGAVHVLRGPLTAGTVVDLAVDAADLTVHGAPTFPVARGVAVADLSGDGAPDLVAGHPSADAGQRGRVGLFFGPLPAQGVLDLAVRPPDSLVLGADEGDHLGEYVKKTGDLDADGLADLLLGAHWGAGRENLLHKAGEAYILRGPFALGEIRDLASQDPDLTVWGRRSFDFCRNGSFTTGDNLGYVLGAGDVSGDGVDDFLLGTSESCGEQAHDVGAGEAYAVFGVPFCSDCADLEGHLEGPGPAAFPGGSLEAKVGALCRALETGRRPAARGVLCSLTGLTEKRLPEERDLLRCLHSLGVQVGARCAGE